VTVRAGTVTCKEDVAKVEKRALFLEELTTVAGTGVPEPNCTE
jgi:hypothetical protein